MKIMRPPTAMSNGILELVTSYEVALPVPHVSLPAFKMKFFVFTAILLFSIKEVFLSPPLQLEEQSFVYPELKQHPGLKSSTLNSRLPKSVVPVHYNLEITPILDPNDEKFLQAPGRVAIILRAIQSTNFTQLHIYEMQIGNVTVRNAATGDKIEVDELVHDTATETLTITLLKELQIGNEYKLTVDFIAQVATDRQDGIYLSQYSDASGKKYYQAATQFQAIGARRAFPCYDEPELRATFAVRIGRQQNGFHSLCNMERNLTIPHELEGYVWDVYPTTVVNMPTYIAAIVVSNFESIDATDGIYRKPVKVWGPTPNMASSDGGIFSVENAAKMLTFYEEFMDFEYEFPKMDSVAVPVFGPGAMENWGLNLYRVSYLLHEKGEATVLDVWRTASVLAHELAHQWFGNLVTFRWWNDIWLSEGFANYFQFHATHAVVPGFEPLDRIGLDSSMAGLEFDGSAATAPVHPDDEVGISIGPSPIVYQKAGNLIRMMEGFLGKETFMRGLRVYLKKMKHNSATQYDLFKYLNAEAASAGRLPVGLNLTEIMDTWTLQTGFPLIRISKADTNKIYISQERYKNNPTMPHDLNTWHVPIAYTTGKNPEITTDALLPKTWMHKDALLILHEVESTEDWLFVNPEAKCHYRVIYDNHYANLIIKQLEKNHTLITPLSRGQLLDDYFKSAFAALEMTTFLYMEDELPVWYSAFTNLKKILTLVGDSDLREKFYGYLLEKVGPAMRRVGVLPNQNEIPVKMLVRTQLLDWACALGHEDCYGKGTDLVDKWMQSNLNPIATDLQPMLYCAAVSKGGKVYWDFMIQKYANTDTSERQKILLLNAIACGKGNALIELILEKALANSEIRSQDAVALIRKLVENNDARNFVFEFLKSNVDAILASRVSEAGISGIVSTLSNYFATEERLKEVQSFLKKEKLKFSAQLVQQIESAISKVKLNIDWMKVHRSGIEIFLNSVLTGSNILGI